MKDSTVSRVRLPIDDVVDEVYGDLTRFGGFEFGRAAVVALDILTEQTEYVVRGVLAKHRAERGQ